MTAHFDLVKEVRVRRLKWTGCILHMDANRLLHKTLEAQLDMNVQRSGRVVNGLTDGHDTARTQRSSALRGILISHHTESREIYVIR